MDKVCYYGDCDISKDDIIPTCKVASSAYFDGMHHSKTEHESKPTRPRQQFFSGEKSKIHHVKRLLRVSSEALIPCIVNSYGHLYD